MNQILLQNWSQGFVEAWMNIGFAAAFGQLSWVIINANTPSERVYQLSHGYNRDSTPRFKELNKQLFLHTLAS